MFLHIDWNFWSLMAYLCLLDTKDSEMSSNRKTKTKCFIIIHWSYYLKIINVIFPLKDCTFFFNVEKTGGIIERNAFSLFYFNFKLLLKLRIVPSTTKYAHGSENYHVKFILYQNPKKRAKAFVLKFKVHSKLMNAFGYSVGGSKI